MANEPSKSIEFNLDGDTFKIAVPQLASFLEHKLETSSPYNRFGDHHYTNWIEATALMMAIYKGDLAEAIRLIKTGKDIFQISDRTHLPAIGNAIEHGRWGIYQILLDIGKALSDAHKEKYFSAALFKVITCMGYHEPNKCNASIEELFEKATELLELGASPNIYFLDETSLIIAAKLDHDLAVPIIKMMFKYGADGNLGNKYKNPPIVYAAYEGILKNVAVLLDKTDKKYYKEALYAAACFDHTPIVRLLLEIGVSPFAIRDNDFIDDTILGWILLESYGKDDDDPIVKMLQECPNIAPLTTLCLRVVHLSGKVDVPDWYPTTVLEWNAKI